MVLFFAACTLFAPATDSAADPTFGGGDGAASEANDAVLVGFVTTWVELGESDAVPVKTPKHATFVRVDSCEGEAEGERVCDEWDGGYLLTEDDTLTLTPSTWDGSWARLTWLQIGG